MKKKTLIISVTILLVVALLAAIIFALILPALRGKDETEFEFDAGNLAIEKQLYPTSHGGRTFYVAADGNDIDHADGSIENPYNIDALRWFTRPIDDPQWKASHFFKPGDQILLKRGDVFKANLEIHFCYGEKDNPITIASYGDSGKRPIIEITHGAGLLDLANAGSAAVIIHECSNIVVRDLEINIKWTSRRTFISDGAGGIVVAYDEVGEDKYENVYIVNNVIHSECIESENPCDANTFGIRLNSYEQTYDLSPDDFALTGFYCTDNLVYNVGRAGISAQGWIQEDNMSQMKFTLFNDVHLDNNIVHDVGTIGIFAGAATGCTMNRNLVYNTGMYVCADGEDPQEGEGGLMSICLKDSEIKYNVTYNNFRQGIVNDGIGIDIDWNCMNIVVQYNYVYACDGSGIGTMANYNCKILNNRVVDNRIITNHPGQISVCDFVPWGKEGETARKYIGYNSPDLLTVRNLEIAENFVSAAPHNGEGVNPDFPGKCLFYARRGNGEGDWNGNTFHDNRVVYSGTGNDFYYNMIVNENDELQATVTWDKFYSNKYFAKDPSSFNCLDETAYGHDESAMLVPICTDFSSWAKRDLGSTFEHYTPDIRPGKPSNAKIKFENEKLSLSWNRSEGDVWHYNIYKVGEGEETSYRNLQAQTKTTSFDFAPEEKGVFYIVIQPESNMGIFGEALKIKISLK